MHWLTSCYSVCVHVAWCKDWKPGGSFGQSSSPQCPGSPPHRHHQLPGQGAAFSSSLAHLLIHFLSIFLFFSLSHHMLIILWSVPYFTTHSFLLILIRINMLIFSPDLMIFSLRVCLQKALQLQSDEHIFKFIKSKFALGSTRYEHLL